MLKAKGMVKGVGDEMLQRRGLKIGTEVKTLRGSRIWPSGGWRVNPFGKKSLESYIPPGTIGKIVGIFKEGRYIDTRGRERATTIEPFPRLGADSQNFLITVAFPNPKGGTIRGHYLLFSNALETTHPVTTTEQKGKVGYEPTIQLDPKELKGRTYKIGSKGITIKDKYEKSVLKVLALEKAPLSKAQIAVKVLERVGLEGEMPHLSSGRAQRAKALNATRRLIKQKLVRATRQGRILDNQGRMHTQHKGSIIY